MATVLTGLQNKDLIAREPSPVHAKVLIARLTDQGCQVLAGAYEEVIVLERALTDAFTPAEHGAFIDLLDRATGILNRQTRHAEDRPAP
jgi:DNA-binding MarR family transcriptional regulator